MTTVDFATFCYRGDIHRLHKPGHLEKQVLSNGYNFDKVIVVYQNCSPDGYEPLTCPYPIYPVTVENIDKTLANWGIDLDRPQYSSSIDRHHAWKNHVVNHLAAALASWSDYIVFADSDCWIIRQTDSWVSRGIDILSAYPDVFIVSPNDGEPERKTQVMSQQMFMARTKDFRMANFNQPGWDGDVAKHPEMPEYHAMLEGRIHHYCKATGRYRYVLGPDYRYWHFNRTNADNHLETDLSKY